MISPEESGFVEWHSIPQPQWSCGEWVQYHEALKKGTGKANANSNWIKAWASIGANSNARQCSDDTGFYGYFKKEGIDTSLGDLDKMWAEAKLQASNVAGVYKTVWTVAIIIVGLIILGLALAIIKNPQQAVSMGTMVASRGLLK
jgi:hypothetical protein